MIGYVPGITRATGLFTTGGADLLQTWLRKIAQKIGERGGIRMAEEAPEMLAYFLTEHRNAYIFMFVDGTMTMYGKKPRPQLPRQITAVLVDGGVTQQTPIAWYQDPESSEAEEVLAGQVISGLPVGPTSDVAVPPPPASAFESAHRIVDELIGS